MAAGGLDPVLHDLVAHFQRDNGNARVRIEFGASGKLARRIAAGMPADVYIAADAEHAQWLTDQGLAADIGNVIALGELAYFVPAGAALRANDGLSALAQAMDAGRLGRFVIADPDHAPHGRAAREALLEAGVWAAIQPHLVVADDAAQAMRYVTGGTARAGLVPAHLALRHQERRRGIALLIAPESHEPLEYRVLVINADSAMATAFAEFLQQPEAAARLADYGLLTPEPD
nr:molybdate ABC transporter substrate-binding protein [Natronocella acetinitrilica]